MIEGPVNVKFNGTAAIPSNSEVFVLVDNPDDPRAAYQINAPGNIIYTREEPRKEIAKLAPPRFIKATVVGVTIYTGQTGESVTILSLKIIQKDATPKGA